MYLYLGSLAEGRRDFRRLGRRGGKVVGCSGLESRCSGEAVKGWILSGRWRRLGIWEKVWRESKVSAVEGLSRRDVGGFSWSIPKAEQDPRKVMIPVSKSTLSRESIFEATM